MPRLSTLEITGNYREMNIELSHREVRKRFQGARVGCRALVRRVITSECGNHGAVVAAQFHVGIFDREGEAFGQLAAKLGICSDAAADYHALQPELVASS